MRLRYLCIALIVCPALAVAADSDIKIVIKNHQFAPSDIRIPADTKVKLLIENQDATPEEFDSHSLNREKVMLGKSKATIFIGPLKKGRYPFMGEFNAATAQGAIIVE